MSSDRIVIVAVNDVTGEVQLPLGDVLLYDSYGAEDVLDTARQLFNSDWSLSLYQPYGDRVGGTKKD